MLPLRTNVPQLPRQLLRPHFTSRPEGPATSSPSATSLEHIGTWGPLGRTTCSADLLASWPHRAPAWTLVPLLLTVQAHHEPYADREVEPQTQMPSHGSMQRPTGHALSKKSGESGAEKMSGPLHGSHCFSTGASWPVEGSQGSNALGWVEETIAWNLRDTTAFLLRTVNAV